MATTAAVDAPGYAGAVGCMSGLLSLISPRHGRRRSRKRLTSASKKPRPAPATATTPAVAESDRSSFKKIQTCEALRSPTIPAEIRRAGQATPPLPSSPRPPPATALVARLMGLDIAGDVAAPPAPAQQPGEMYYSASEKRRRLLDALEKCDEELRALRRIIAAAVRDVEPAGDGEAAKRDGRDPPIGRLRSTAVHPTRGPNQFGEGFKNRNPMLVGKGRPRWRGAEDGCRRWRRFCRPAKRTLDGVGIATDVDVQELQGSEVATVCAQLELHVFHELVDEMAAELVEHCCPKLSFPPLRRCRKRLHF